MEPLYVVLLFVGIAVIGFLVSLMLTYAEKKYAKKKNVKALDLRKLLPGENCGVCGYKTCAEYAEALSKGEAVNRCIIGGNEVSEKISDYLGVPKVATPRLRAQVMCSGTKDVSRAKYRYEGIQDCMAVYTLGSSPKECPYGCIGLGSCVKSCPFGAIKVENGVAVVEYEKCRACGNCVNACPQRLIELVPFEANVWVGCHSHDSAWTMRKYCLVGCTACRKCEDVCEHDAIRIEDNVAKIDYTKCVSCGECSSACPRGILWRGDIQIRDGDTIKTAKQPDDGGNV